MNVSVHLMEQSQPVVYSDVKNTYTKDGLYCLYLANEKVHKFPIIKIWRIIEDYGFHGREGGNKVVGHAASNNGVISRPPTTEELL